MKNAQEHKKNSVENNKDLLFSYCASVFQSGRGRKRVWPTLDKRVKDLPSLFFARFGTEPLFIIMNRRMLEKPNEWKETKVCGMTIVVAKIKDHDYTLTTNPVLFFGKKYDETKLDKTRSGEAGYGEVG